MTSQGPGEARLEVSLAQAIINEVKYGSETNQLAEVSLLAAFQNRAVGEKLAHALCVLMPGLQYLSIGALLKDGVIVRTSNLVNPGPVDIVAQTLRGSAARVAARKHSAFHVKRLAEDPMSSKYYELQEAWDQARATSVLSVPIPAVRAYESASILLAPGGVEETAHDPSSHVCQVLHNMNGAVGIMTIGLCSEEIDLHGRQGKAFDAMAQSLSPFLAYYTAPVLEELHSKISAVANANASLVAKFKARHQQAKQSPQSGAPQAFTKQGSGQDRPRGGPVVSPFSVASYPETMQHSAQQPPTDVPAVSPQARTVSVSSHSINPFAQAGRIAFSNSTELLAHHEPQGPQTVKSGQQKQPVSPFAAAAEASGSMPTAFAPPSQGQDSQAGHAPAPTEDLHDPQLQPGGAHAGPELQAGSCDNASVHSMSSSEEIAPEDLGHEQEQQGSRNSLDIPFAFKRTRDVSSAHVRRYSTSIFFQGMLHNFSHLSSLSSMASISEKAAQEQEQQQHQLQRQDDQSQHRTVFTDDNSYAPIAHQMNRRALSTPQGCDPPGDTLEATDLSTQIQAQSSCPYPLLHASSPSGPDAMAVASVVNAHLAVQKQLSKSRQHGVMLGQTAHFGRPASDLSASALHEDPWFSQHSKDLPAPATPATNEGVRHVQYSELEEASSFSKQTVGTAGSVPAVVQHPIWMTFSEPQVEARFDVWMGQRCSKVDTVFLLAATVYITQLLFYTWALVDQQAKKWPLLGYTMLPVLLLQHGDTAWYVKNRSVIVTTVRCFLLVFLTLLVPAIVKGSSEHPTCSDWIDISGMWPLAAISMGLLVKFRIHAVVHAISCACLVLQGLHKCMTDPSSFRLSCNISSVEKLAAVTCIPTVLLYGIEMRARRMYLQTTKH